MKKNLLFISLLFSIVGLNGQSFWRQMNGPSGGSATQFLVDDNGIWAAMMLGGPFYSSDGLNWQGLYNGLGINTQTSLNVNDILKKGNFLFIATDGDGVYRSGNNGQSWNRFVSGLNNNHTVKKLMVINSNLLAFTSGGLFISTNDGVTWNNTGLTAFNAGSVVRTLLHNGKAYVGLSYTSTGMIFSSDDEGLSWTAVNNPGSSSNWYEMALYSNGNRLYCTPNGKNVFYTENDGATWTELPAIGPVNADYSPDILFKGDTLFVSNARDGVYRFNAANQTWVTSSLGLPDLYVEKIAVYDGRLYAAMVNGGIYRSGLNGNNWTKADQGIGVTNVYDLASNGTLLFAGTAIAYNTSTINTSTGGYCGDGFYLSADNGNTWQVKNTGIPLNNGYPVRKIFSKGNTLIAAAEYSGLFSSNDNGETWVQGNGLPGSSVYSLYMNFASNGNDIYFANYYNPGNGTIYKSSDEGLSWQALNMPASGQGYGVYVVQGALIACVYANSQYALYRSTDGGASWNQTGSLTSYPYSYEVFEDVLYLYDYSGAIRKTSDGGQSWVTLTQSSSYTVNDISAARIDNTLYLILGLSNNGTVVSDDGGATWNEPAEDLPLGVASTVRTLLVSGDSLLAGTDGRGVWKVGLEDYLGLTTGLNGKGKVDLSASLSVFPNPTNLFSTLNFELKESENVRVSVFDLKGKKIAETFGGKLPAGRNALPLQTSEFENGIYIVTVQGQQTHYTTKLVVQKN